MVERLTGTEIKARKEREICEKLQLLESTVRVLLSARIQQTRSTYCKLVLVFSFALAVAHRLCSFVLRFCEVCEACLRWAVERSKVNCCRS